MKKILTLSLCFVFFCLMGILTACGGSDNTSTTPTPSDYSTTSTQNSKDNTIETSTPNSEVSSTTSSEETSIPNSSIEQNLPEITGVTLSDKEVTYDGQSHSLEVSGNTDGVTVTYEGNGKTDAGTYDVLATLKKDGFKDTQLLAKLIIKKKEMSGITFSDATFEYDTFPHTIQVTGNVPNGAEIKYTLNGAEFTEQTEVGVYTVNVLITHKNYVDFSDSATLKITSKEKLLFSAVSNGNVYFQNDLDDEKLYYYNGTLKKASNDIPTYIIENDSTVYFYSSSLLSSNIKTLNTSTQTTQSLYKLSGEYLATDGTYLYYAVNNTLINTDKNGIYKVLINGETTEPIKICDTKASYLTVCDNTIYYSNNSDGGKLYKVSTSGDSAPELIHDEKVEYIIEDNGNLYFTSSKTLVGVSVASAIYRYQTSNSSLVKLTTDNGKYLTKVGNYIYYVNNDLLTSTLFGDGIYRVLANLQIDSSLPGEKVLSAENNGYSSLTSDDENIYYYKLNDKHFYQYDISSEIETDLMEGFVPVDDTVLSGYAKIAEYNGEIYYTNPLETGSVYKYNLTNKNKILVLSDSVSEIKFNDGYLYYSTYVLSQYALWKMDLNTNETVKISSSRCDNLIFEGDYIYYIDVNAVTSNKIMKMKNDGTEVTEIYDDKNVWINDMTKIGNDFYFIMNPALGFQYLYKYTIGESEAVSLGVKSQKSFVIANNLIYYHNDGAIYTCALDGSLSTKIISNADVNDMIYSNGTLYYSSTKSGYTGLYAYKNGNLTQISTKPADGLFELNGSIYFIQIANEYTVDYPANTYSNADGKLYVYDGTNVTKIA